MYTLILSLQRGLSKGDPNNSFFLIGKRHKIYIHSIVLEPTTIPPLYSYIEVPFDLELIDGDMPINCPMLIQNEPKISASLFGRVISPAITIILKKT
jgi:hypothetical protein